MTDMGACHKLCYYRPIKVKSLPSFPVIAQDINAYLTATIITHHSMS